MKITPVKLAVIWSVLLALIWLFPNAEAVNVKQWGQRTIRAFLWGYNGTSNRAIRIDSSTRSLQIIDYEHHEIHGGSFYETTDVQNVNTTTIQWMITTPDTTKWAHMIFDIQGTGEIEITVTEGADRTGTNALDELNANRNSANTAGVAIHRAVSGGSTDGAVTLFNVRSGATGVGGKTIASGGARGSNEKILDQNTKYIVTVETFADIYVTFRLEWYEHTDKDA